MERRGGISLRLDGNPAYYIPNLPLPVFLFLPIISGSPRFSLFPSFPPPVISHFFASSLFHTTHPNPHGPSHPTNIPFSLPWSQSCLTVASPHFHRLPLLLSHFLVVISSSLTLSPFVIFVTLPHLHRATSSPSPCLIFPVLSRGFGLASPFPSCLISLALPHFSQSVQSQSCAISTKFCVVFTVLPHPSRRTLYIDPLLFPTTSCPSCLLQIDLYTSVQKTSGYECRTCVSEFKFSH